MTSKGCSILSSHPRMWVSALNCQRFGAETPELGYKFWLHIHDGSEPRAVEHATAVVVQVGKAKTELGMLLHEAVPLGELE